MDLQARSSPIPWREMTKDAGGGRREPRHGFERIAGREHRPRHGHWSAYATVVLSGAFIQTGYTGRYRVEAGDVLVQPTLDWHADQMISAGTAIIRLPWRFDAGPGGVWRGCDIDEIWRLSKADVYAAAAALEHAIAAAKPLQPILEYRPDRFFADLIREPNIGIQTWACASALSRENLSREFRRLYDVSPSGLRGELRARTAWRRCIETNASLADIALETGFADQAHMTRSLRRFTGTTPAAWRRCRL